MFFFQTAMAEGSTMSSPRRSAKSSSTALTPSRGLASLSLNSTKKVYNVPGAVSRPGSPTKQRAPRSPTKTPSAAVHRRSRSKSQTARDGGVGRDVVKESTSRPGSPQKTLQRRKSNKVHFCGARYIVISIADSCTPTDHGPLYSKPRSIWRARHIFV